MVDAARLTIVNKRIMVKSRLREWGFVEKFDAADNDPFAQTKAGVFLYELFGFPDYEAFSHATEDNPEVWGPRLDALSSVHGYALIRAILARKEVA